MNPPGGRRQLPLNQDFFVGFGKTILELEEVVVSVFIPFSRKVKVDFSCAADGDDAGAETSHFGSLGCADPSRPAGGAGSSIPTCSQEGELLCDRDNRDESVLLRGIQRGSGRQYLLRWDGSDHRSRHQNLL